MKKRLLYIVLLLLLFTACDKYKNYRLDGMWQLKTVVDVNGNENKVDTVFYSFQREVMFSVTILENPEFAKFPPFYGYMDMLSDNKIHLVINNSADESNVAWFLSLSGWSAADVTFDIKEYNGKNLVLFDSGNGKTYTFKKF